LTAIQKPQYLIKGKGLTELDMKNPSCEIWLILGQWVNVRLLKAVFP
jgi:hypothetical protein